MTEIPAGNFTGHCTRGDRGSPVDFRIAGASLVWQKFPQGISQVIACEARQAANRGVDGLTSYVAVIRSMPRPDR